MATCIEAFGEAGTQNWANKVEELTKLQEFVKRAADHRLWRQACRSNTEDVQRRRDQYVRDVMYSFDREVLDKLEEQAWSWSPAWQILKGAGLATMPTRPWRHDLDECNLVCQLLCTHRLSIKDPIGSRCLPICRVLKVWSASEFPDSPPMSDIFGGLTLERLHMFLSDKEAQARFALAACSLFQAQGFFFPSFEYTPEQERDAHDDVVALIGSSSPEHDIAMKKVEGFHTYVRQKTLGDMASRHEEHLKVLWYGGKQAAALNEWRQCLFEREALESGSVADVLNQGLHLFYFNSVPHTTRGF